MYNGKLPQVQRTCKADATDGIMGAWIVTVTPTAPPGVHVPSIKILAVLTQDGNVVQSEGVPVPPQGAGPAKPPLYRQTTGFGGWVATGANEYALTFARILVDQKGRLVGITTVRGARHSARTAIPLAAPSKSSASTPPGR